MARGVEIAKVRDQEVDKLGEFKLRYDKVTRGYTIEQDEDF